MPASFLVDRPAAFAGSMQPFNHHHHVGGHELPAVSMASRGSSFLQQSGSSAGPHLAFHDLVSLAAASVNTTSTTAVSPADADVPANWSRNSSTSSTPNAAVDSSPVLGRSAVAASPTSSASSSSSSMASVPAILGSVDGTVLMATLQANGPQSNCHRKSNNMTECVPVPSSEHVAEIVGRQGSKIKALRNKTNTYIKTPVRGEEPVFVITGRREDVAAAKREILSSSEHFSQIRASRLGVGAVNGMAVGNVPGRLPVVGSSPSSESTGQVTIQVRVPYRVVGLVVGPKGATIKRIQQDSATYIVTPSRDREPVFEVTGTPEGVEKARSDIVSYIAQRTGTSAVDSTGVNDAPAGDLLSGGMGDCPELDVQALFGSVLKLGTIPGLNVNNNQNSSAMLTTYHNTMNQFDSNRLPANSLGFVGQQPPTSLGPVVGNGIPQPYDNSPAFTGFANNVLRSPLDKPVMPAGTVTGGGCNVNNNVPSSPLSEVWPAISNVPTDQLRNLMLLSLLQLSEDQTTSSVSKCSPVKVGMQPPSLSDQVAELRNLESLISTCVPPQNVDYGIGQPTGIISGCGGISDQIEAAFQLQHQFNGCIRSSGSVESNLSSISPADSTTSIHRGIAQSSMNGASCLLCSEAPVTSALVPCGHKLFCKVCADSVVSRSEIDERRCPVCREPATLAVRILS